MRRECHVPAQVGRQSTVSGKLICASLVVRLTVHLDNMSTAAISCQSRAQLARRSSTLVGYSHDTCKPNLIVISAFVRTMNPSKGSRAFYKRSNLQKSQRAILRRRRSGRSYMPPSLLMILRITYPLHVSAPSGLYLFSVTELTVHRS
jgi:hypothetical protein